MEIVTFYAIFIDSVHDIQELFVDKLSIIHMQRIRF